MHLQPAQQVLRNWQGVIGKMRDLQSLFESADEAVRAHGMTEILQALQQLNYKSADFDRLPKACCERLVFRMKVRYA